MKRRRFRKQAVNVSLFPFLAVLICTMGTLIVLLVLVVQQARVYASAQDESNAGELITAEDLENLRLAKEDFVWRREILEQQRSEVSLQLANSRLQLGHLEEHIRALEQEWHQLETAAAELQQLDNTSQRDEQEVAAELARLEQTIQAARDELARVKHQAATRPRSFAIIPYDGPHSTRRRPIYIECTENGIVLQPEGITLTPEDFAGPSGPGNPLDAALRTVREHLAQTGRVDRDGEPYPLLVVRPRGTVAYLVAREAIKSWDDEFGYELIDADMKLEFPAADPVLREQLVDAIEDARQRQAILASAMPSRFKSASAGLRGTPSGSELSLHDPAATPANRRQDATRRGRGPANRADLWKDHHATGPEQDPWSADKASVGNRPNSDAAGGTPDSSPASAGAASFSLEKSRGANWALRGAGQRATGITRPIRVVCLPDRLIILPQRGEQQQSRVVPLAGPLRDSIDEFVTAIWKHTEQWGIAVLNGYWKPVLNVEVAPEADQRFAELQSLLDGSGLDAKRVLH